MVIKEVMEDELVELIEKNPLVLVDYSAVWCGPCSIQHDILDRIGPNVEDKVIIVSVDIDKNEHLAGQLRIHAVPTLQFFKDGKKVVFKTDEGDMDRFVGVQAPETLELIINKLSEEACEPSEETPDETICETPEAPEETPDESSEEPEEPSD